MAAKADSRMEEDNLVRMALNLEVRGKMKKEHSKSTWKGKVKDSLKKILFEGRGCFQLHEVEEMCTIFRNRVILSNFVDRDTTRLKLE